MAGRHHALLDNSKLRYSAFAVTGVSLIGGAWLAARGMFGEAAIMAGFVLVAVAFAIMRERLPSIFTLLFATAGAVNALGYVFELWHDPVWFDEAVHLFTPFTIVAALGWLLVARENRSSTRYAIQIIFLGLAIGTLWEGFEWAIGIVGSWRDTLIDLLMDTIGAGFAAWFCIVFAVEDSGKKLGD